MLTQEEQELIIKVTGAAEVERLTSLLESEEGTLRELAAAKAAGLVTDAAYEAQVKRTAASLAANQTALDAATGATARAAAAAAAAQTKAADTAAALAVAQAGVSKSTTATAADMDTLKARLAAAENQERALAAAFLAGKINADQFRDASQRIGQDATPYRAAAGALGLANNAASGLNTTIRNVGFGLSDVFSNNGPLGSKLGGFANNVGNISTGILAMLGKTGPAALAAAAGLEIGFTAIGAALTAFGIKSVGDLTRLFTGGVKEVEDRLTDLKDRVKELEDKPVKLAVDVLELQSARAEVERIEAALKAVEALRKNQEHYEKAAGAAVSNVFAEAKDDSGRHIGADEAVNRLTAPVAGDMAAQEQARAAQEQGGLRAEIDRAREMKGLTSPAAIQSRLAEIKAMEDKLAEAVAASAKRMLEITKKGGSADLALGQVIRDAETGQGARQAAGRERLAKLADRAGLTGVAGGLRASSPEDIMEAEKAEEELDESIKRRKKLTDDREKAEKARRELNAKVVADRDRELAEAGRDVLQAVGGDVKKDATLELAGGKTREEVRKRVVGQIRAALDEADQVREEIRDAVAEAVGGKLVTGIQEKDVATAKATGETKESAATKKEEAKAKKDRDDLAAGLGDDFLAGAETERMGLELDPNATAAMKANFQARLRALAITRLRAAGHSLDEATRLASGAGALVDSDIQQRMDQARADAGAPNAPAGAAMEAAYNRLFAQMRARPAQQRPAAPQALKRRGRPSPVAPGRRPLPSIAPKADAARKKADARQAAADRKGGVPAAGLAPPSPRGGAFGAAPSRLGAPDPAAAVAPVQRSQAAMQGAMGGQAQALASVARTAAVIDQRTQALETGFRQIERSMARVQRTNQSMST